MKNTAAELRLLEEKETGIRGNALVLKQLHVHAWWGGPRNAPDHSGNQEQSCGRSRSLRKGAGQWRLSLLTPGWDRLKDEPRVGKPRGLHYLRLGPAGPGFMGAGPEDNASPGSLSAFPLTGRGKPITKGPGTVRVPCNLTH